MIVYTNTHDGGLDVHRLCCTGQFPTWYGVTLFLGCGIEIRDHGLNIPRIASPAKFQRVDLHGIPVPERSPTGEAESDAPKNGFFVDVFNLAPTASFPEVSLPLEGGELALELRRDGGVRSAQTATHTSKLPITHPTDDLLGLGWSSNLSARAIISRSGGCNLDPPRVTFTDSGGTVYQYLLEPGNTFRPEVYDSQANAAISATPSLTPTPPPATLTLKLKHGTEYSYKRVGTFYPQNNDTSSSDEYYRLDRIKDRNANEIVYEYSSGFSYPAGSMLVSAIKEAAHPLERRISFLYWDYNGAWNQNGYDWGIRLLQVTDPLGRVMQYDYTQHTFPDTGIPPYSRQRHLLTKVTYPVVEDGNTGLPLAPTQHYEYELRVTPGPQVGSLQYPDTDQVPPFARILHVGLKGAWQNGDPATKTRFTYKPAGEEDLFPVAVHPVRKGGSNDYRIYVELQKALTLTRARTATMTDQEPGTQFSTFRSVSCGDPCPEAAFQARTRVTDPRGKVLEYAWTGVARPLSAAFDPVDPQTGKLLYWNQVGWATVIDLLQRFTKDNVAVSDEAAFATVEYAFSNDLYGNLRAIVDMSGNRIDYFYGSEASQESNQPTQKRLADSTVTNYEYEGPFNKLSHVTDPQGKVTTFSFDARGNRTEVINQSPGLDGLGDRKTTFTYDSDGFVLSSTERPSLDPLVERTTSFNRQFSVNLNSYYTVTTVVDPGGLDLTTVRVFDVLGNLRKETPPEGFAPGHSPDQYETAYQYDSLNRLTTVTRPGAPYDGGAEQPTVEQTFYDLRGNVVKKVSPRRPDNDPGGSDLLTTTFVYDTENRPTENHVLLSETEELVTKTKYDAMGMKSVEIDARGADIPDGAPNPFSVTYTYDILLRLSKKELYGTVDGTQQLLQEEYQYETQPPPPQQPQRLNSGSGAFAYNVGWKPLRVINARGFATDYKYDQLFRTVQSVRRRGGEAPPTNPSDPARDAGAGLSAEPQETMSYDSVGNPIRKTIVLSDADKSVAQTTCTYYDDFDRPTVTVLDLDGDGDTNQLPYAPESQRINHWYQFDAFEDPEDIVAKTRYDLSGKLLETSDPEGRVSTTWYDTAGRPDLEAGPPVLNPAVRPTVRATYDKNGAVLTKRGPYPYGEAPSGRLVGYSYDKQGRLVSATVDLNGDGALTSAADIETKTYYDRVGNAIQAIDALSNATRTLYDKANRKIAVVGPSVFDAESGGNANPVTELEYDKNSNLIATVDPRGVRTEFQFDPRNLQVFEKRAAGLGVTVELITEKQYDANGNLTELTVLNSVSSPPGQPPDDPQTTVYGYDELDRLVQETYPGTPVETKFVSYYRDGKQKATVDPEGQALESEYDLARRPTSTLHKRSDGTTQETRNFAYDKVGNLLDVQDGEGASSYDYDSLNRVTSETRATAGQPSYSYTTVSAYDLEGHRTRVTYPGGTRVLTQAYDWAGRLTSIADSQGPATFYQYDKNGNVTRLRWPNDDDNLYVLQTVNTYDALSRLAIRVASRRLGGTVFSATLVDPSSSSGYDLAGNLRKLTESINGQTRVVTYSYDDQYRLTAEAWTDNAYYYDYNPVGNRVGKNYTYTGPNGTIVDQYAYTYNSRNELQSVDFASTGGSASTTTTFTYDKNGSRKTRVAAGVTTAYTWDVSNRLTQVQNDGSTVFQATYDYRTRRLTTNEEGSTTHFVYDGGLCIQERPTPASGPCNELVNGLGLGGGIGGVLYEVREGTRNHFVYNQVGHNVLQVQGFPASGEGDVTAWNRYEAFGSRFGFAIGQQTQRLANTKERDPTTGLYNHGFRYYDPVIGRYVSRDPLGYASDVGLYSYVHNNPVVSIDPVGLDDIEIHWNDDDQQFDVKYVDVTPVFGWRSDPVTIGKLVNRKGHWWADLGGERLYTIKGLKKEAAGYTDWEDFKSDRSKGIPKSGLEAFADGAGGIAGWAVRNELGSDSLTPESLDHIETGADLAGTVAIELPIFYATSGLSLAGTLSRASSLRLGRQLSKADKVVFGQKVAATARSTGATLADDLAAAATRARNTVGRGSGGAYGTRVHSAFEAEVNALGNPSLSTEISYLNGQIVPRGTPGSVRLDVVNGPLNAPVSIFDLKTGSATLTPARIQQIQSHIPGGANVPVFEVRP
ncbi:MAG: RHS repeat protein [Planctomycetes bacterium]|nr:RHS repeat protein [Planctomycetota bacterium]